MADSWPAEMSSLLTAAAAVFASKPEDDYGWGEWLASVQTDKLTRSGYSAGLNNEHICSTWRRHAVHLQ